MKKVLALILAISMLAVFTACTPAAPGTQPGQSGDGSGGTSGDAITITVRGKPKENDTAGQEILAKRLEDMKAKYPNITVDVIDFPYDVNTFLPKAAAGQLPTLYNTYFTEANKIISQGFSMDITDLMKQWGYDTKVNPTYLEMISKDGRIYGLPTSGYAMGMWYNNVLFKEAGLVDADGYPTLPKDTDELAQMAVTIKEKTGSKTYFFPTQNNQGGWYFSQLAWSFGGEFEQYNEDGSYTAIFNSPEVVEALQWLKDMKWEHDVVQDNILVDMTEMHKLFAIDQMAISQAPHDQLNGAVTNYNGDITHFAMGPNVAGANEKGRSIGLLGGSFECIAPNATAEQADASFKWLENEGTTPNVTEASLQAFNDGAKVDNENKKLVGVLGVPTWTDPEYLTKRKEAIAEYVNVDLKMFEPYTSVCEDGTYEVHAEHPVYCQELYKILDSCVQAVLTDANADPQALLDKAVTDFQRDYLDKANSGADAQ